MGFAGTIGCDQPRLMIVWGVDTMDWIISSFVFGRNPQQDFGEITNGRINDLFVRNQTGWRLFVDGPILTCGLPN